MKTSLNSHVRNAVLGMAVAAFAGAGSAAPLVWDGSLPTAGNPLTSQQYQDFTIYSLNYLSNLAAQNTAPTNPYFGLLPSPTYNVDSSPGQLHNNIVNASGSAGAVLNNTDTCGATGCDNAYLYSGTPATFFNSMSMTDPSVAVPGEPTRSTWTAQASALRTFLGSNDLVFMFNLNEDNSGDANTLSGQSLLVSMRVQLTDAAGNVLNTFYVGANNAIGLPQTAAQMWASNGAPIADPADPAYNPMLASGGLNGYYSQDPRWAFIHGAISVDATTGAFLAMGDCTFTGLSNCKTINQNLGANEVAFSAFNQQLSDLIADANSGVAFMNVDMLTSGQSNGYEQLFIMGVNVPMQVPEPGSLALAGLALAICSMVRRRNTARA